MNYVLRMYKKEDKAQIFQLFEDVFGISKAEKHKSCWDWEFINNPNNPPEGPRILVLENNNKIVGLTTAFPVQLKIRDKLFSAFWVGDFITHPQYRGRGGFLLSKILYGPHVFLGTPNPVSYPVVKIKRFNIFDYCQPLKRVNIIDLSHIIEIKFKNRFISALGGILWKIASTIFSVLNHPILNSDVSFNMVSEFDEQIDEFWQEASRDYDIIVVRDKKYLNWRFVDCPNKEYSICIAKRNGKVSGYIVFRYSETDGLRQGYIVDLFAKAGDEKTLQALVQKVVEVLKANKVDLISCLINTYNVIYHRVLRRNGFIFKTQKTKVTGYCVYFPHLEGDLRNSQLWFMTRADSDLDLF